MTPEKERRGKDLGNIDVLNQDGDSSVVSADWGHVRVQGAQPYVELES